MKKLVVVLASILLMTACSTSTNSADNSCLGKDKELNSDERVEALLVDSVEVFEVKTDDSYTLEQMKSMAFGFNVLVTDEPVYVAYELCDQTDSELVTSTIDIEITLFYEEEQGGGNYSNFMHESGGEALLEVESGKDYAVNVFISDDNEDWQFVATREFSVE